MEKLIMEYLVYIILIIYIIFLLLVIEIIKLIQKIYKTLDDILKSQNEISWIIDKWRRGNKDLQ